MSNEVEFNSLTANDEVKVKLEQPPSRIPQKPSEEEVAKYSKTRIVLVVFFTLIIIAMVVAAIIIIIVSPKCSKAREVDKDWFKGEIVYQISPSSFKDSNGDGKGDLKGIAEQLDYFKYLGVKILFLDTLYDEDFKNISSVYGKMSDFEDLIKKAKEKDMKVVINFIPNYTSDKHKWFVDSKAKVNSAKRGWYVWRPKANNWLSVTTDGSAWEQDTTTNEFYLHQFDKNQPDLNLRNDSVLKELNNVLTFWADKGVEGFRLGRVQYMLEDKEFRDEKVLKQPSGNSSVTYNMLDHNQTFDLPGNLDIVKQFRATLDKSGTHKLLILDVKGKDTGKFFAHSDLPIFTGLISDIKKGDVAQSINKSVSNYLASVPKDGSPSFAMGDPATDRVGARFGDKMVDAMNVLLLTLPGTPMTYFGEELGMSGSSDSAIQWNDVEAKKKDEKSHYAVYQAVSKLRQNKAFKSKEFKVVHVDSEVFAYTRGDKYLVVINFSDNNWDKDLEGISGTGKVVLDSKFKLTDKTVDVNKFPLQSGQAVIVELHNVKYM